ncbi:MAG: TetR/AcrR family transcriptional regulator [Phycisphaerales bacterium]|nr:TetR/AcrR family transcriptional regulator [Phycisphaerales bacterium]
MKRGGVNGRTNQRRRTRKDLLSAATQLMKSGRTPTMDEVAEAAMVSRATAYRYFPSIEALLVEAPLDGQTPEPGALFQGDDSTDPVARVDKAEAALHEMVCRNEAPLRMMLAASLERSAREGADDVPVRQNRRTALIEAALAPVRDRLSDEAYERLCLALATLFGIEAMVVFRDVLGVDEETARSVKSWAARTLVQAALDESGRSSRE